MKINPIIDAPTSTTSTSLNKQQVNLSPFKTNDLKFNKSNYLDIFSYHDKIAELLNETNEQKQQRKIKNKNILNLDRRSFYDNQNNNNNQNEQIKSNDIELLLVEQDAVNSTTTTTTTTTTSTSDDFNLLEENNNKTTNNNNNNVKTIERDDFDDLVDMTHRIPKKMVIKFHSYLTLLVRYNSLKSNYKYISFHIDYLILTVELFYNNLSKFNY
jgi:hypothetical protein